MNANPIGKHSISHNHNHENWRATNHPTQVSGANGELKPLFFGTNSFSKYLSALNPQIKQSSPWIVLCIYYQWFEHSRYVRVYEGSWATRVCRLYKRVTKCWKLHLNLLPSPTTMDDGWTADRHMNGEPCRRCANIDLEIFIDQALPSNSLLKSESGFRIWLVSFIRGRQFRLKIIESTCFPRDRSRECSFLYGLWSVLEEEEAFQSFKAACIRASFEFRPNAVNGVILSAVERISYDPGWTKWLLTTLTAVVAVIVELACLLVDRIDRRLHLVLVVLE